METRPRTLASHFVWLCAATVLLVGCAQSPAARPADGGAAPSQSAATTGAPKTLRIAIDESNEPRAGMPVFASGNQAAIEHFLMFDAGLTVYDQDGNLQPRIATKVPSLADGDWKVNPDGSMQVTWKLRPDVLWHDGAPLVADDFVFDRGSLATLRSSSRSQPASA
jgi:ABC-type transport system substrate-binding protein